MDIADRGESRRGRCSKAYFTPVHGEYCEEADFDGIDGKRPTWETRRQKNAEGWESRQNVFGSSVRSEALFPEAFPLPVASRGVFFGSSSRGALPSTGSPSRSDPFERNDYGDDDGGDIGFQVYGVGSGDDAGPRRKTRPASAAIFTV
ncbi:UNVERIFIED_CONTAM: hypothetical protein PYX00_002807 [Menopon gallinae]|uniref:Uncharacterized protein n=1 Tax=Menopon gallinae TaxID=328185 RepID=A0AAW2HY37_9NEOP